MDKSELADLEGVEVGDDGRLRAKMAKNANGGRADRDEKRKPAISSFVDSLLGN